MKPVFETRYRRQAGMAAWLLHRLSGLALIFYLCLHIFVIHNLAYGPERFDKIMKLLASPLFKVMEFGLMGVILYHAFNGLRVIAIDFWGATRIQKQLFWIMMAIASALFALGAIPMAGHLLHSLK